MKNKKLFQIFVREDEVLSHILKSNLIYFFNENSLEEIKSNLEEIKNEGLGILTQLKAYLFFSHEISNYLASESDLSEKLVEIILNLKDKHYLDYFYEILETIYNENFPKRNNHEINELLSKVDLILKATPSYFISMPDLNIVGHYTTLATFKSKTKALKTAAGLYGANGKGKIEVVSINQCRL